MSTEEKKTGNGNGKEEKKAIAKGLQIRNFDGKIAEDKAKGTPEIKYTYDRIVLPWSRTGKDSKGNEVLGAVPTMQEVMAWVQAQEGFTIEFSYDSDGNLQGPSAVGFLVDGINGHLNRTARVKAENTPQGALEKSIQMFMSKMGLTRDKAIEQLQDMLAASK